MGEFLLPFGGQAWTSTFIEVMRRLGVEAGTTRQALSRTALAGWLHPDRLGRRTRWRLTPNGEQLLVEGTKRIYEFAGPATNWDGRWLVVLVSVPDTDRPGRHLLRSRLAGAGLGSPAPGVWVGTRTSSLAEVEEVLDRAGLLEVAQVFRGEHLGRSRAEAMVAQAWDLQAIEADYQAFMDEFAPVETGDPLARVIELVHAWRRFPWRDPALPRELLPPSWQGAVAARLFQDRHARWTGPAGEEWCRVSSPDDPTRT